MAYGPKIPVPKGPGPIKTRGGKVVAPALKRLKLPRKTTVTPPRPKIGGIV